ncbi:MAG: hypothetical protein KDD47_19915, partial [Acidobacteria bacterium]|nr:hypothetical protein [Acidobacteriota bacterium]
MANGKLDRRTLAAKAAEQASARSEEAPRTAEEATLRRLWSEVLGLPEEAISVSRSFFHLGGHSLTATRLAALVRKTLEVELPLPEIFARPTVAEQAALL